MQWFILSVRNVTRQYAGTMALDAVGTHIISGEIVGLIGEDGAGKSTLMRIVSGIEQASSGQITVRVQETRFANPQAARQMMAIARRVMQGGSAFIMDEPTSSLTGEGLECGAVHQCVGGDAIADRRGKEAPSRCKIALQSLTG